MIPREEYDAKLNLARDIVRMSGGISTFSLARAMGLPLATAKRIVRALIVDGLVRVDTSRVEERTSQRGPKPYLLVPAR
jgi:hypothetical protein